MSSVRLTNDIRDGVLHRLLLRRFGDQVVELLERQTVLGALVYEAVYDQKARRLMASLPEGWLPSEDELKIKFGSDITHVYWHPRFDIETRRLIPDKYRQVGPSHRLVSYAHCSGVAYDFHALHALSVEHHSIQSGMALLKEAVSEVRGRTRSALNTATTVGKLKELWPELEPFLRGYERVEEGGRRVPSIPVADLNKALDLPVPEAAAS